MSMINKHKIKQRNMLHAKIRTYKLIAMFAIQQVHAELRL